MKTASHTLANEIEAAAKRLQISTSTLSKHIGQGGEFYKRLRAGKRVWPETVEKTLARINEIERERSSCLSAPLPESSAAQPECFINGNSAQVRKTLPHPPENTYAGGEL